MGAESKIEWTDHTFNPWEGCTKVSTGCLHCYAERRAQRFGTVKWGPNGVRRLTSDDNWRNPARWDLAALQRLSDLARMGLAHEFVRPRVFCASLADVFEDNDQVETWRHRLFNVIRSTPNLEWLLLTKRPENVMPSVERYMLAQRPFGKSTAEAIGWAGNWLLGRRAPNVRIGVSVEDQERAEERLPELLRIGGPNFVSAEPLLGHVDFSPWIESLHWIIVGGESGPEARPMNPSWAVSIRDQCDAAGVPFFFKQWGEYVPDSHIEAGWWNSSAGPKSFTSRPYFGRWEQGYYKDFVYLARVGKEAAGRLLDGREWGMFPVAHDMAMSP